MQQAEQHLPLEPNSKYAIAIRYGLMTGFVSMFLTTISFLYILKWSYIAFLVASFFMFMTPIVLYGVAATRQKKVMGGFMTIKDAFQVIFVVILISLAISTVYGLIYNKYIDPEFMTRMKEAMVGFFEQIKMPQDKIDDVVKNMDEASSTANSASKIIYSFAQAIIMQSIFGFIVALIVRKEKPNNNQ